ncbi:MAG: hypothetical protein WCO56_29005 [Verrucomicrobiota bacterium]
MKVLPVQFEQHAIRRIYDEKTGTWWFSVVDIIQVLTQQPDYQTARKYWNKLKERLKKEGSQSVTTCHQLKLPAADQGKALQWPTNKGPLTMATIPKTFHYSHASHSSHTAYSPSAGKYPGGTSSYSLSIESGGLL